MKIIPKKSKIIKEMQKINPVAYIPTEFMYDTKEGTHIFKKITNKKRYWVTRDNLRCINENKKLLSNLLKNKNIIEFGGFDGSILNEVFLYGWKKGYSFKYTNVDLADNVEKLMERNFEKIVNVEFNFLKRNFNNPGFIKKIKGKKAVLMLGSTFGNYLLKKGEDWLKKIHSSLNKGDLLILGFDKKTLKKEHIKCYDFYEMKKILMLASIKAGIPPDRIIPVVFYFESGIRGGVLAIDNFIFKNKSIKNGDFIQVAVSLKYSLNQMKQKVAACGFKIKKIFKSSENHIYHLVLEK